MKPERFDRPTDDPPEGAPTRRAPSVPEWQETVEQQRPTDAERELGRVGIAGARAALQAARPPQRVTGDLIPPKAQTR